MMKTNWDRRRFAAVLLATQMVVADADGSDADVHRWPGSIRAKLGDCAVHLYFVLDPAVHK